MENSIKIFEQKKVRSQWDEQQEKWWFSIVDVIEVLTESIDASAYWRKLKQRLKEEGNETVTNCHTLKMEARDGKMRVTDVADTEQLLRLIQSVPSPKAEPFKLWLAQVGSERLDEMQDPEISIDRALQQYLQLGYSENWINQRCDPHREFELNSSLKMFSTYSSFINTNMKFYINIIIFSSVYTVALETKR